MTEKDLCTRNNAKHDMHFCLYKTDYIKKKKAINTGGKRNVKQVHHVLKIQK